MQFEDEIFLADEKPQIRPSTPAFRAGKKQARAYFEQKEREAKRNPADAKTTCRNEAKTSQSNMHAEAKFTTANRLYPSLMKLRI